MHNHERKIVWPEIKMQLRNNRILYELQSQREIIVCWSRRNKTITHNHSNKDFLWI